MLTPSRVSDSGPDTHEWKCPTCKAELSVRLDSSVLIETCHECGAALCPDCPQFKCSMCDKVFCVAHEKHVPDFCNDRLCPGCHTELIDAAAEAAYL